MDYSEFNPPETPVIAVPASTQDGMLDLYGTPEHLARLAWMSQKIKTVAGVDILIMAHDDIQKKFGGSLQALFKATVHPDVYNYYNERYTKQDWQNLANELDDENPLAYKFDFDEDGIVDFGVIAFPHDKVTATGFAQDLTAIDGEKYYKNIPVSDRDVETFVLLHEAAHLNQWRMITEDFKSLGNLTLAFEVDSDRQALKAYEELIQEGHGLSPELPEFVKGLRLAGSLSDNIDYGAMAECTRKFNAVCGLPTHSTHIGLQNDKNFDLVSLGRVDSPDERSNISQKVGGNELSALIFNKTAIDLAWAELHLRELSSGHDNAFFNQLGVKDLYSNPVLKDLVSTGSNPPLVVKALLDKYVLPTMLRDAQGNNDNLAGLKAYKEQLDEFFDKYIPGYKSEADYTRYDGIIDAVLSRKDQDVPAAQKTGTVQGGDPARPVTRNMPSYPAAR